MEINRIEVIDHCKNGEGRVYIKKGNIKVDIEYQDNNQTIKIFLSDADN